MQKAITNFETSIPKPRLGITEKKQSTTQLKNLFMSADKALINIDTIVEIIRLTQPNFYNGYKSARKLIETGNGSLKVKGIVTDAVSGEPIKGASLSFVFDGKGGTQKMVKDVETRIKKTAKKGGFNIKSLPAGMYTVTIKKIGYADHVATIAVSNGDLAKLNIQLSKN